MIKRLSKLDYRTIRKIICIFILFELIWLFVSLYGDKSVTYTFSIFNLLVSTWKTEYVAVFTLYILSLLFVLNKNIILNRISLILYVSAFILNSYIGLPLFGATNSSDEIIFIYVMFLIFVPLFTFLFYLPIIFSKESLSRSSKEYTRNIKWGKNIPLKEQLAPFIPLLLIIIIFTYLAVFIEDKLICLDISLCVIQGDWFSKAVIYFLAIMPLAFLIVMGFWPRIGVPSWQKKGAKKIIPIFLITFIYLTFYGYNEGFSSNNSGFKIRSVEWGYVRKVQEIKWQDIRAYKINTTKSYDEHGEDCNYRFYIIKKDGMYIEINEDYADDRSLWKFFSLNYKIPTEKYDIDECDVFNKVQNWRNDELIQLQHFERKLVY